MENEILIAENVEIDLDTLAGTQSPQVNRYKQEWLKDIIVNKVIKALSPEDRKRLEEYREQ